MLGPTEVEADGRRVDLGGPLPRRLVAALLAEDGRMVGDGALADAIWAGSPPAGFRSSLQAYVSRLRRAFGADRDALERLGDGYRLRVRETDAHRFAAGVEEGRRLVGARPADALRAFDAALALWRGEAFADLPDSWAAGSRARLAELRSVADEERLAAKLALGDAPGAVGELDSSVRAEPYRERRWELLILALYRSGRQADALAALREVRARLADELGIDPGPALRELETRLLAQDPALLLPPVSQPPTPAVGRPISRFLGRRDELARLAEAMAAGQLVTLVGPGGAGKTRLAVEFAAGRTPFFARLADLTDPGLVAAEAADAAGVRATTAEALAAALADVTGLLVLDNCEHLIDAVAALVLALLPACPGLRVLATSREPLGVDGERLLPVDPLPPGDAVALLTDRITAVRPGWRPGPADAGLLARIATAMDGIPLALELAAARARVLGLGELLDLIEDRFPALGPVPRGALSPHQTLGATIAWSIGLLPAADRALLFRLWPFEGGFTLAAADGDLDGLSSLVARSVVVADTTVTPSRYRLLELVRSYLRLHDPEPAKSRAVHAAWVRGLVERTTLELAGPHSAHAIRTLNRELANLRAGIVHDLTAAPAFALRTAGLLDWFWFRGGHVADGMRLIQLALSRAPDAPGTDRARARLALAMLQFLTGEPGTAVATVRDGVLALGPGVDPATRLLRAQAHFYMSLPLTATGDFEEAARRAYEATAVATELGDQRLAASGEIALGWALAGNGDIAAGHQAMAAGIDRAAALGQTWTTAMGRLLLARCLLNTTAAAPAGPAPLSGRDLHTVPAGRGPEAALAALRTAVGEFAHEDDVGNVLNCLLAGALALLRLGRTAEGATLAAAVRREVTRRGLDPESADPAGTAALDAALADFEPADTPLDREEMIALLAG